MAQHDYNIANAAGATVRADINSALSAIASNNSGSSEPSTTFAYEWWIDTSTGVLKLRNSGNSGWVTMPFSISSDNTVDINGGTVNGITSLSFSSGATVASILDEDNLSSDSATALATQQSIKAYVDSQVTAQDLDISDGSSTIAIDLDSETLSLLGGTGITSTASGNGVTFAIGQSVGTSDNVVFNQVTAALVGNASTATALATARTISGVSFDGTANITLDTDDIGEGSNKYYTAERVDDQVNTLLTAGTGITLTYNDGAGTLTIDGQTGDITSVVAGDGLTGGGTSGDVTLTVGVDDSSIEINSDALRVKASGITNAMLGGSIANAKLANSSITINSQAIALGGSHTFDTDDIGEGSSNLYYTTARANSAIDSRVTNTFINDLTGVVADTATALATGRTIALSGDVTATGVSFDGTGNISLSTTIAANSVALGTDTTGNYVATIADAGNTRITVANSGSETAAITLDIADDAIGTDQIANNAVALGTQSTGNYVATIAGTTNEVEVSGSGSETAAVTIGLPDNVTIAGNLTVNGTTTTVNTSTLEVEDPLIKLAKSNSGADSVDIGFYGLYDTSGSQDLYAGLFRDASDSGKFKLFKDLQAEPTTTVNTSGTGYAGGTLVATFEGSLTGNVTGQVSTLSNHDTDNLSEGSSNLYFTNARARSAISASGDISYNSSTGVISFTQSTAPVTSVNSATGAVVLDTDDIAEGSNLYMTTERVQDIAGGMVTGNTETGITVTYDDSDGTLDFVVGTLNQDTTGNAATATALETARAIALSGDVVGTANFDGTAGISISTTIQANSVALATDTTGDYVSTITAGTGLTSTGATSGEGVAHSLSVDAAQTQITSVGTLTGLTVDNVIIDGTTIGHTSDTDLMTLADGVLTVAGELDATSLDISGNADIDGTLETDNLTIGGSQGSDGQVLTSTGSGVAWEDSSGGVAGIVSSANATAITIGSDELVTFSAGITSTAAANTLGATSFSEADLTNVGTIYADQYLGDADTDSGIVLAGSNVMTLHTNNSERMRIDASGNVGIGETTPESILHIKKAASGSSYTADGSDVVIIENNSSAAIDVRTPTGDSGAIQFSDTTRARGAIIYYHSLDDMYFNVAGTSGAMILDSTGTLSITHAQGSHTNGLDIINSQAGGYGSALNFKSERSDNNSILSAAQIRTQGQDSWNSEASADSNLFFATALNGSLTDKMVIKHDGAVGIGTSSPSATLDISSTAQNVLDLETSHSDGALLTFINSGTVRGYIGNAEGAMGQGTTNMAIRAEGALYLGTNGNNARFTIGTSGDVGFNTTDVTVGSSVSGSSTATPKFITYNNDYSSGYTDASLKLYLFNSGTTRQGFTSGPAYDLQYHSSGSDAGRHAFYVANTETMRINKGTVSINSTLTKNADMGSTPKLFIENGSTSSTSNLGLYNSSTANIELMEFMHERAGGVDTAFMAIFREHAGNAVGSISINGSATTYNTSSDYRLKTNIRPIENGIDRVNKLKPVKFDWIDNSELVSEGFIAHEVDEIFGDAVSGVKDEVDEKGKIVPQSLDYGRITPLLVKAIQEQQEQIDALQSEINTLKGE